MIVTCPACATRFEVDETALGTAGRRVRCGSCRHVWLQSAPEPEPEPEPAIEDTGAAEAIAAQPQAEAAESAEESAAEPAFRSLVAGEAAPERAARAATSAHPARPRRQGRGLAVALWLLLLIVVGGVVAGAATQQERIVAAWPEAQRLYDAIGYGFEPVNEALKIQNVAWERQRDGEAQKLVVKGEVTNVSKRARAVPKIRGILIGAGSRVLHRWDITVPEPKLLPGETAQFRTELRNPPDGAERITFLFAEEP
jgi:predicted Zn finger-like uncharacterized protein